MRALGAWIVYQVRWQHLQVRIARSNKWNSFSFLIFYSPTHYFARQGAGNVTLGLAKRAKFEMLFQIQCCEFFSFWKKNLIVPFIPRGAKISESNRFFSISFFSVIEKRQIKTKTNWPCDHDNRSMKKGMIVRLFVPIHRWNFRLNYAATQDGLQIINQSKAATVSLTTNAVQRNARRIRQSAVTVRELIWECKYQSHQAETMTKYGNNQNKNL